MPSATLVISLAAIAYFASGPGQSFLVAVFIDHLIDDAGTSRTLFSSMYALATVASALTVLAVGKAIDKRGTRLVWAAITVGLVTGCLILSWAEGPLVVLLALCLMRAFGQGSFPLVGTILVATRFHATRGRMLSFAAQGLTAASIVLPFVCVAATEAIGWRPTLRLIALFLVVLILPLALVINKAVTRPDIDVVPSAPDLTLRAELRRRGVIRLLLVFALPPLVTTGLVVHAVSIVGQNGLDKHAAALAIGALAAATVIGTLLGGYLVDRASPRIILTFMSGTFIVSSLLLLPPSSQATFLAYCVLGIGNGAYVTANGSLWAQTYGVKNLGRLQSLGFSGQIAGAAAGPLPLAIAVSISGGYEIGLLLMSALCAGTLFLGWAWSGDSVLKKQRSAIIQG